MYNPNPIPSTGTIYIRKATLTPWEYIHPAQPWDYLQKP